MNPCTRGRLLVAAIMAVAFMSYVTLAAAPPKAAGGGIYELEVSNLAYSELWGMDSVSEPKQLKFPPARFRR